MRLYEFDNPLRASLVAVVDRLVAEIEDGSERKDWTVDEFISYLKDNGIDELDESYLFDLIKNKKPPLSTYISNIKQHNIVWKGINHTASADDYEEPENNEKIVKNMAKKAMKR
jgi:hypothetical protein